MKMASSWRIIAVSSILAVSLVLAVITTAYATGGPHQNTFSSTTDACAVCHRTHTGAAAKILKSSSQYNLCISCHDGAGADTKVTSGVYLGSQYGTQNAGLRGGGFEQALMNTALSGTFDETGAAVNITSRHTVGTGSATAWGAGTSGSGETVALECGNCHNPHGNSNYRLLRPKPTSLTGWEGLTAVNIPDEASKNYTISYGPNYNRDLTQYSDNVTSEVADWCSQCHTRYNASEGSGHTSSGSPPFEYRHPTQPLDTGCLQCHSIHGGGGDPDNPNCTMCHTMPSANGAVVDPHMSDECFSCHVAHGSSASMSDAAAGPPWPDGSSTASWQTGTEGEYSRLLTIDNRGVCVQCHTSSSLVKN